MKQMQHNMQDKNSVVEEKVKEIHNMTLINEENQLKIADNEKKINELETKLKDSLQTLQSNS